LEKKGVTVLDMAGLAQKGGAVLSHVQIAASPQDIHATRIATGEAALIIGCDAIVTAGTEVMSKVLKCTTYAAINSSPPPTAAFNPGADGRVPTRGPLQRFLGSLGEGYAFLDPNAVALGIQGDGIYANSLLLVFHWEK